ncbi:pilus assembly PilX family protein [Marinobacterium lutimaris]|nr:PilX N-terminal domain-containing pilus assembly protein [Marinobacterium lutimaris]
MRTPNREGGAVLIVALVLMVAATLLALSQMKSSLLQERMTSNQYAKETARLAAEQGAARAMEWINGIEDETEWNEWVDDPANHPIWHANPKAAEVAQGKGLGKGLYKGIPAANGAPFLAGNALFWIDPDEINTDSSDPGFARIKVHGAVKDPDTDDQLAYSSLVLRARTPSGGNNAVPPFASGLVGCEGVNMVGSGQIDSFDSRIGGYGDLFYDDAGTEQNNSLRSNVTLQTFSENASANFAGHAPLYGDLSFTGQNLTMSGSTPIYGDVYAEGDVEMNGSITGTLNAGGNVTLGSASSSNQINAGGNVSVESTGSPPSAISAAGEVSWPDWWQYDDAKNALTANYKGNDGIQVPAVYDSSQSCDQLGVRDADGNTGNMFESARNGSTPLADAMPDTDAKPPKGPDYQLKKQGSDYSLNGPGGDESILNLGSDGEASTLSVDAGLTTSGNLSGITIHGDVTIVVSGDFNLGSNTQLNVSPGATLTLLVEGKTTLSAGTNLTTSDFTRTNTEGEASAAVQIYSAYQSSGNNDVGVSISGANSSSLAIYSPYATARITGSGALYGAIRSRYLDIRGSGDIHYDEALGTLTQPGSSGGTPTAGAISGWFEVQ